MKNEPFRGDIYSVAVRNLVVPLWAAKERSPYPRLLKHFEKSQYRPYEDVRADQWARAKTMLSHAWEQTEYYREKLMAVGISPGDIRSWGDWGKIPILTKDDIRGNVKRMIARNVPPETLHPKKTSGSTGVSLDFFIDDDSAQWKRAYALRCDQWTGWRLGEKIGAIWGNPEYRKHGWRGYIRNLALERFTYLDTLRMDEGAMSDFHRSCVRKKPTLLFGHAHSIYLFAKFLEKRGLGGIRPKGIISTAMVLHGFERELIERVFGCKVTNRYGCEEVSLIACECGEHRGLHTNCDTLLVEVIRDGCRAKAGETGAIVVTDLTNRGMPFIRYKVGDAGVMSDATCPCGCTYPLLDSIEGRIADYVVTPDGEYISGISLTENFAICLKGVKQLQIVQEKIDHLVFRVVKGEDYDEATLHDICLLVRKRFGDKITHEVEFTDSIQQERSGKYRFCISKIQGQHF